MNLLPEDVIPSVLCYAVCKGQEDEEAGEETNGVDIVYCNSNGYLIEVVNKKILNICSLMIDDAVKVYVYYNYDGENCEVYYLVRNGNGVLLIIRKQHGVLTVIKCLKDVKECKIFDFEKRGYPQVGIQQLDSDNIIIINFSKFDEFKLGLENYFITGQRETTIDRSVKGEASSEGYTSDMLLEISEKSMEKESESNILSSYLSKKLQEMEIFRDELCYEVHELNLMLKRNLTNKMMVSPPVFDKTSKHPSREGGKIQVKMIWQRIYNSFWILGIEFERNGIRDLTEMDVVARGEDFSSYVFRFFDSFDGGRRGTNGSCTTEELDEMMESLCETSMTDENVPGSCSKSIVVVALKIPEFGRRSKLSVSVALAHGIYQCHSEAFYLKPECFLREDFEIFRRRDEVSLCEDLMACLAANRQVGMLVEVKYNAGPTIGVILREELGFRKVEVLGGTYYVKENGYFGGTLIAVTRIWESLETWKLDVSVKDLFLLDLLLKRLRSLLPMPVRITLDKTGSKVQNAQM